MYVTRRSQSQQKQSQKKFLKGEGIVKKFVTSAFMTLDASSSSLIEGPEVW